MTIKTVYRVSLDNGRFEHVRGKIAAINRAVEMLGFDPISYTGREVARNPRGWGVEILRITPAKAREVGLA